MFRIVTGGFKSRCRRRLCMKFLLTHAGKLASESSKNSFFHKWQASNSRISFPLNSVGLFHREVGPVKFLSFFGITQYICNFSPFCGARLERVFELETCNVLFQFIEGQTHHTMFSEVGMPEWVWPKQWTEKLEDLSLKLPHYLQACTKNLLNKESKVLYAKKNNQLSTKMSCWN